MERDERDDIEVSRTEDCNRLIIHAMVDMAPCPEQELLC